MGYEQYKLGYRTHSTLDKRYAFNTDKLRAGKRARDEMEKNGLSPTEFPMLRDFLSYLCRNPGIFEFKGLADDELRGNYRGANRSGHILRKVWRLLPTWKRLDCTDNDLLRAMEVAISGRYRFIHTPLVWDEHIQYTPRESWALEYRQAGYDLLHYVITEKYHQ